MANLKSTDDRSIRVLHVDDSSDFLKVSKQLLTLMGNFEVDHALCVDEAFQKLEKQKYDVVVSDYEMPKKGGLEFLSELREQNNHIPFVLFTGKSREEVAIKALNLGADGYINKQGSTETVYGELAHTLELVNDRKRAEIALRKSESHYRLIAENARDVIWTMDLDGHFTYVSPSVFQLRGYTPEEVLQQSMMDALTPDSARVILEGFQRFWETGAIASNYYEVEQPCKDGSTVWTEVNFTVFRDKDGKPESILGVSRDITEHKKAEEELRKERQELDYVIDSSPIIIFYKDKEGKFVRVNKAFAEALQIPPEEFVGKTVFDFYSTKVAQGMTDDDFEVLESGHPKLGIIELYESASGLRWVQTDKVPVFDEKGFVVGLVGFAQDITERKQAEKEQEILAGFLNIVNRNTQLEGLIKATVAFLKEQSGCEAVGIRLKRGDDFPYYEVNGFPDEFIKSENSLCAKGSEGETLRDSTGNPVLECMCGNVIRGRFDPTKECFTKFGSFWANSTTKLLATASDEARQGRTRNRCNSAGYESVALIPLKTKTQNVGLIQLNDPREGMFSLETISLWERVSSEFALALDRSLSEAALKQSEKCAQETTRKLAVANEKLHVVGGLTRHDVGNKLTVIKSNMYLLKRQIGNNSEVDKFIREIDRAISDAGRLFEFSCLYEKIGSEKPININVEDCFNEAAGFFADFSAVKFVNASAGLVVAADSLLRQLFYNLIENTLKHGEKVTEIKLSFKKEGDCVKLVYEDDGVGVPEANKSRIFQVFSSGRGSGLGLKFVSRMLEVYGWKIIEEGTPGKGAKFVISIPKKSVCQENS